MAQEYLITKASYDQGIITWVEGRKGDGRYLGEEFSHSRQQMWLGLSLGRVYRTISKAKSGPWNVEGSVSLQRIGAYSYLRTSRGLLRRDSLGNLPEVLPKRKVFISYFHKDDQRYKRLFEELFGDLIINKSVRDGDINSGNSDEYIKHLIQNGYLDDTSVMVVLISQNTRWRKHIDWEISGALNRKVGGAYAGLIGLHLPHHVEFGSPSYDPSLQPARLAENAVRNYASIYDWTQNRVAMQWRIETAFSQRDANKDLLVNDRLQMEEDLC